jgi:hypothetical protein
VRFPRFVILNPGDAIWLRMNGHNLEPLFLVLRVALGLTALRAIASRYIFRVKMIEIIRLLEVNVT